MDWLKEIQPETHAEFLNSLHRIVKQLDRL